VARLRPILALACALLVSAGAAPLAQAHAATPRTPRLTGTQRQVADQLVSVFENDTTKIRYDYVVNLHDGCGITAGRAGFCSATGDMLEVVQSYARRRPGNQLAGYLPVLRARARDESDDVLGLGPAFTAAWQRAARSDARFRAAQDHVVDEEYLDPAAQLAGTTGLASPLAVAIFYDTAIEQGAGDDPDGLPALIARTRDQAGGGPAQVGEAQWLTDFLAVRRADLLAPHDRSRRVDWPESVGRVEAFQRLLGAGQLSLAPPVAINPWGDHTFMVG
jgi:chitosanase